MSSKRKQTAKPEAAAERSLLLSCLLVLVVINHDRLCLESVVYLTAYCISASTAYLFAYTFTLSK